jgi:hypothetical protein
MPFPSQYVSVTACKPRMLQRLGCCDPPRRIQSCHSAHKITELRIHKVPPPERLSGIHRVEAPRESDQALEKGIILTYLLQQALKAVFVRKE